MKEYIERMPGLYLKLLRLKRYRHWSKKWVVTPDTDCVIEGFPRSANSFALSAFQKSNPPEMSIATHTHSPAQIIQAVHWNIPTMICIRKPFDAVRGLLALGIEIKYRESQQQDLAVKLINAHKVSKAFHRWLFFHNQILPYQAHIFIAPFERIIKDYETLSDEFVLWSGKNWNSWRAEIIPPETIKETGWHIAPNANREKFKSKVEQVMLEFDNNTLLNECNQLYSKLIQR